MSYEILSGAGTAQDKTLPESPPTKSCWSSPCLGDALWANVMTGRFPVWNPTPTWQNVIEQSEVINAALINYCLKKKILLRCYWAQQVTPTTVTLCQLESMLPGCSSPWQHTPSSYPAELASQSADKKRDRFNVGTTSSPEMMLSPSGP